MNNDLLAFLASHNLCTISTVNAEGSPQAAYVGYSETPDMKLYIGTSNQTRKYKNLQKNPHVAVVIADLDGEIQYEGVSVEVKDSELRKQVEERHIQKVPGAQNFLNNENQAYFEISPTWIRFIEHTADNRITEMTEFPL